MSPPATLALPTRHALWMVQRTLGTSRGMHASALVARDVMEKYRKPMAVVAPTPTPPPVSTTPHAPERRDKEVIVEGVPIPPKPIPPGDEDCCMSGCVHCVLTIYADDLSEYNSAISEAEAKLKAKGTPESQWPSVMHEGQEVEEESNAGTGGDPAMAAFMALEAKLKTKEKPKAAAKQLDPTVSAFLALEDKLRKKHHQ